VEIAAHTPIERTMALSNNTKSIETMETGTMLSQVTRKGKPLFCVFVLLVEFPKLFVAPFKSVEQLGFYYRRLLIGRKK
jgi:hypothetical protein